MTTAWQILQQEWNLPEPHAKILTLLLTETPVALRGEEAMVPLSKLRPSSIRPTEEGHPPRTASERSELSDLLQKTWTVEVSGDRFIGFPFVSSLMFVNDSQFMRYQLSGGLVSTLQAIKRHYKLGALV